MVGTNLNTEIDSNDNCSLTDESGLCILGTSEGVPGANVGVYQKGCIITDTVNGFVYINTGSTGTPVWTVIGTGGAASWGTISGTLSNQTDLQNALDALVPYTGATTDVDLGTRMLTTTTDLNSNDLNLTGQVSFNSGLALTDGGSGILGINGTQIANLDTSSLSQTRTFTFPDADGTITLGGGTVPPEAFTSAGLLTTNILVVNQNAPIATSETSLFAVVVDGDVIPNFVTTFTANDLLTVINQFTVRQNQALTAITVPLLSSIGDKVDLTNNDIITTYSFPSLTTVGGFIAIGTNTPLLSSISFPVLDSVATTLNVSDTTVLPTISFPSLTAAGGINMVINVATTSISLPLLTTISAFSVNSNPALTTLSVPVLASTTNILELTGNTSITSFSFPQLVTIGANINMNGNTSLTTLSFPLLTTITQGLNISSNNALTAISLPTVTFCDGISINSNSALTTIDLSGVTTSNNLTISSNPVLTSVDVSSLDTTGPSSFFMQNNTSLTTVDINAGIEAVNISFSACALSTSSVDNILADVDAAGFSSGNLDLSGGTNSAPTGGAGNANVLSLQGKGWTVSHN